MKVPGLVWRVAGTGLKRAMCWRSCVIRYAVSTECAIGVSSSSGILRGSPYSSSATAAVTVRWLQDDRQLSGKVEFHVIWPGSGRVVTQTIGIYSLSRGRIPQFWLWCPEWGWLLAIAWSGQPQWGSMCILLTLKEVQRRLCGCEENGLMVVWNLPME
jgi:hypothetical protein